MQMPRVSLPLCASAAPFCSWSDGKGHFRMGRDFLNTAVTSLAITALWGNAREVSEKMDNDCALQSELHKLLIEIISWSLAYWNHSNSLVYGMFCVSSSLLLYCCAVDSSIICSLAFSGLTIEISHLLVSQFINAVELSPCCPIGARLRAQS